VGVPLTSGEALAGWMLVFGLFYLGLWLIWAGVRR